MNDAACARHRFCRPRRTGCRGAAGRESADAYEVRLRLSHRAGTTPITQPGCPYRIYSSSGTYRAKHLGRGTYLLNGCIPQQSLSQFVGTLDLATRRGDELHAVGTGEGLDRPLHHVPFVITSGTGRFADATGTLFLDFFFLNETNCLPGHLICRTFDEIIVVSGTITPK